MKFFGKQMKSVGNERHPSLSAVRTPRQTRQSPPAARRRTSLKYFHFFLAD